MQWDQPSKPPTVAQAVLRQIVSERNEERVWNKIKDIFAEIKSLFTDRTFVIITVLLGYANAFDYYRSLFLSEILRPIFQAYFSADADKISSYLIVGFEVAAIVGTVVSGRLVDHIKNYLLLLRVYFVGCIACWVGFIVAFHFHSVPAIFVTMILSGVGCGLLFSPLYEMSTQHTYPRKPEFIGSCLVSGGNIIVVLVFELNRLVLDGLGGLSSLIYMAVILFICFLLTVFLKPKYHRLETEKEKNLLESSLLLNDVTESSDN